MSPNPQARDLPAEWGAILARPAVSAQQLHALWRDGLRDGSTPPGRTNDSPVSPAGRLLQEAVPVARAFTRAAIDAGEFLLAGEAARAALRTHPGDPELRRSLAQTLARLGSVAEARWILRELEGDVALAAPDLGDVLRLSGDLSLQEAQDATFGEAREAALRAALDSFERAERAHSGDPQALLRSAVAHAHLGERHRADAVQLAERSLEGLGRMQGQQRAALSVLLDRAKAHVVLGRTEEARAAFRSAAEQPDPALHALGAARREARELARALGEPASCYDACFPPLRLIAFSGHMVDAHGRTASRFPARAEQRVRLELRARLAELEARVGFSSAAAGADLLFIEELCARGGAAHVVLPWTRDAFVRSSVAPCGPAWIERFDRALAGARSLRTLGEPHEPSSAIGYEYANEVMAGLARLTARSLDLDLTPLAVWDGQPGAPGGTAAFVSFWRERGIATEVVSVSGTFESSEAARGGDAALVDSSPEAPTPGTHALEAGDGFHQQIKAILFADIVGYSRLPEALIPVFVREFKGRISRLIARSQHAPTGVSTWGDALHFVFDDVRSAGLFTLDLLDEIGGTDWAALGLAWDSHRGGPELARPLNLRAALHAGPVFAHFEPIVRQLSFTGAHVTLAARIEPIAEPGEIFASEAFAALSAVSSVPGLACDFVGTLPLAKSHVGDLRVYRLRRVRALPLDAVARVMHEAYCRDAITERGETPVTNPSLRAWEELPEDLQASNREAAADIPAKLRLIGCELEPCRVRGAGSFAFREDELDLLARREHERWCASRRARGWVFGEGAKDEPRRRHPRLVPWEALPEAERRKDFASVQRIPSLLAEAGFRIRRARAAKLES